ncbi:hypothetical protein [Melissospora conviva]|uniref:hypothetical protein n=1 Tax=Melissospora conviva TaxID=3388432 RepID=UPI003B7A4C07
MNMIWVTGGKYWGFRFLRDGGYRDPLPAYDEVFSMVEDEPEVYRRVGDKVALRFSDPLQRKDTAGRTIPHEFVIFGSSADRVSSVEDGIRLLWPLVADEFARIWDAPSPPSAG